MCVCGDAHGRRPRIRRGVSSKTRIKGDNAESLLDLAVLKWNVDTRAFWQQTTQFLCELGNERFSHVCVVHKIQNHTQIYRGTGLIFLAKFGMVPDLRTAITSKPVRLDIIPFGKV